jgi:hypothetical protein
MTILDPAAAVRGTDLRPAEAPQALRERLAGVAMSRGRPSNDAAAIGETPQGPVPFSDAVQRFLDGPARVMRAIRERGGPEMLRPVMYHEVRLDPAGYAPRDHIPEQNHPTKQYEARGFSEAEKTQQATDVSRSALDLISKLARSVEAYNQNLALVRQIEAVEQEIGADDGGRLTDPLINGNSRLKQGIESAAYHLTNAYGASGAIFRQTEDGRLQVGDFSVAAHGDGWSMTAWSDGTLQTLRNGEDITNQIADRNPLYGFEWDEPGARLDISA